MSDDQILEFSNKIAATEVPKVVEQPEKKKVKPAAPKKLNKLPEMDEYSAMLMYTQSVKQNAGVHDSYTDKKNQTT